MSKTKNRNMTILVILMSMIVCALFVTFGSNASVEAKAEAMPSLESLIYTDPSAFQFTAINATECSVKLIDNTIKNVRVPKTAKINGTEYVVTVVASNGFASNSTLETVILSENVWKIDSFAFQSCANLYLVFAPNLNHLGMGAFMNCPELLDIIFPSTLTTVEAYAFMLNNTTVHARFNSAPSNWTNWNDGNGVPLANHDFNQVDEFGCLWTHDFIYEDLEQASTFSSMGSTTTLKRLAPLQPLSQDTNNGHRVIEADVVEIGPNAYSGSFLSITTAPSTNTLNLFSSAFANAKVEGEFSLNRQLTYNTLILESIAVFSGVEAPSITLPTPAKIYPSMFLGSSIKGLNFITSSGTVTEDEGVIRVPSTITTIGDQAFKDVNSIQHLYIPSSVTSMGQKNFENWKATQTIYMPFLGEAHANTSFGTTSWKGDNCKAVFEYMGGFEVALQPQEVTNADVNYYFTFKFKIDKSVSLSDFTFPMYASAQNTLLITIDSTTDQIVGDYRVRTWQFKYSLRSTSKGGDHFGFTIAVAQNGVELTSLGTNNVKVHYFIRSVSDFTNGVFGDGTQTSHYGASTEFDYCLATNINLGAITDTNHKWLIFGGRTNYNTIYGNGYTITYSANKSNIPTNSGAILNLFYENKGIIKDLKVNATFTVTNNATSNGFANCSNIVYKNAQNALIENCQVIISANVTAPGSSIGGVAIVNGGTISNCTVSGNIVNNIDSTSTSTSPSNIGGIATTSEFTNNIGGTITGCTNKANITGYTVIGGIIAQNCGVITNCINVGELTLNFRSNTPTNAVGGIVGINQGVCSYSKNTGTISFYQISSGSPQPCMGMIIGRHVVSDYAVASNNTVGGSIDYGNLPNFTYNRQYAGYREIGLIVVTDL